MATVPSLPTFSAGEIPTAQKLNQMGALADFANNPPRCWLTVTATASQTMGQSAYINFDTVLQDSDNMSDLTGAPSRITINTAGVYLVLGSLAFSDPDPTVGNFRAIEIWKNGGFEVINNIPAGGAYGGGLNMAIAGTIYCTPGDYIRLRFAQSATNSKVVNASNVAGKNYLNVRWMGNV